MPRTLRRLAARILAGATLAGATLAGLAACAPSEPGPAPTPTTDAASAPLFASDEEALAAAVEAYEAYLAVSAEVASSGKDFDRIKDVTTAGFGMRRASELQTFADAGLHLKGSYRADTASLTDRSADGSTETVVMYICQDVSGTRVLNRDEADVTPADRDERAPMVVEVRLDSAGGLIGGSDLWSGDNFC
jgi:hypothetical protein